MVALLLLPQAFPGAARNSKSVFAETLGWEPEVQLNMLSLTAHGRL